MLLSEMSFTPSNEIFSGSGVLTVFIRGGRKRVGRIPFTRWLFSRIESSPCDGFEIAENILQWISVDFSKVILVGVGQFDFYAHGIAKC